MPAVADHQAQVAEREETEEELAAAEAVKMLVTATAKKGNATPALTEKGQRQTAPFCLRICERALAAHG